MPDPNPTLESTLLQKASSIGAPQVGTRYLPTEGPKSLWDLVKQYVLGEERPRTVQAQDPFGDIAWMKGAGSAPGLMMGSTEPESQAIKKVVDPLKDQLYSRLTRAFESGPESMHPSKAMAYAKNRASTEEIGYRKLPELLDSKGNQPVTKSEILSHLEANPIKVKETVKGGPLYTESGAPTYLPGTPEVYATKYAQYQQPGGTNYKENLIQLEKPEFKVNIEEFPSWAKKRYGVNVEHAPISDYEAMLNSYMAETEKLREAGDVTGPTKTQPAFRSNHWDEPDILTHTRSNDRQLPTGPTKNIQFTKSNPGAQDGQITLNVDSPNVDLARKNGWSETPLGDSGTFLEEVQSDWHQQGKERGYKTPEAVEADKAKIAEMSARIDQFHKDSEAIAGKQFALESEYNREHGGRKLHFLEDDAEFQKEPFYQTVSNMQPGDPFENDPRFLEWKKLGEEYNKVNKQRESLQEEIINLRASNINSVPDAPFKESWPDLALKRHLLEVANDPEKSWLGWTSGDIQNDRYSLVHHVDDFSVSEPEPGRFDLSYQPRGGGDEQYVNGLDRQSLAAHIGQDLTNKILEVKPNGFGIRFAGDIPGGWQLSLKGEGMKSFYDNLLPARANKLLKPFGAKVEQGAIPTGKTIQPLYGAKYGLDNVSIMDQRSNEPIASVFPRPRPDQPRGEVDNTTFDLIHAISKQNQKPETFASWIVKLTPEMKERIKKEGFPLLTTLYMVWQAQQGKGEQAPQ